MGWLIALGILILLGALPLGIRVRYDEDGIIADALAARVPIRLYPRKKKKPEKNPKEAAKEETPQNKTKSSQPKKTANPSGNPQPREKKGGSLTDFLPLVKVGLNLLGDFRRKLRVNRLEVKLNLAGDDPCDLATNYGRIWAAIGNLMPRLERFLVIQKRDIDVQCDFMADKTLVTARLDMTITLGRLLALAVVYGIRGLKEFIRLKNKGKGGAEHERKATEHDEDNH